MMNNCTNNFIKRVIGVTRTFKWTITTNGAAVPLVAEDLTLQLVPPRGEAVSLPFDVDDNIVSFTWQGEDQHIIGCYSLILWANYGEDNQRRVDIHNFVELIPWSDRQSGEYSDLVEETIELETADFGENIMVVDNLNSTSATDALSANMGRQLNVTKQDVIQDLAAIRSGAAAGAAVKEWAKNDPLITDDGTQVSASKLAFNGNLFEQWVPGIASSIGLKGIAGFLKLADISQWDSAYNDRMLPTVAAVKAKLQAVLTALATIEAVIPSQASSTNKLTDKDYVDGAIATNTANFVGTFDSLAELQAVQNPTKNDYGFVIEQDAQGNEYYDRYKYTGTQWLYEYKVESTPFTTEQWAAIQSGITAALVSKLSALPTNAELNTALAGKQPVINDLTTIRSGAAAGATAYQKPSSGIPASDMASAVQTSLGKADAALSRNDMATVNGSDITHGGNVTIVAAEGQTITIDAAPTEGSNNAVSSGGVYNALNVLDQKTARTIFQDLSIYKTFPDSPNLAALAIIDISITNRQNDYYYWIQIKNRTSGFQQLAFFRTDLEHISSYTSFKNIYYDTSSSIETGIKEYTGSLPTGETLRIKLNWDLILGDHSFNANLYEFKDWVFSYGRDSQFFKKNLELIDLPFDADGVIKKTEDAGDARLNLLSAKDLHARSEWTSGSINSVKSTPKGNIINFTSTTSAAWQGYLTAFIKLSELEKRSGVDFKNADKYLDISMDTPPGRSVWVVLRYAVDDNYSFYSTGSVDAVLNMNGSTQGLSSGDETTWAEKEIITTSSSWAVNNFKIPYNYKNKQLYAILICLGGNNGEKEFKNVTCAIHGNGALSIPFYYDPYKDGILELNELIEDLDVLPQDIFYAACGDSITNANHTSIEDIQESDPYMPIDGYSELNTYKRKNYAYYIAKKQRIQWANYGYGGTTLSNCVSKAYPESRLHPFVNDRITQLKTGVEWSYISIMFGWNDNAYGPTSQKDKWLFETYGQEIGYPVSASQIGTNGFATQAQKDACDAATGTVDGVYYDNSAAYFFARWLGNIASTDKSTWYGAWNYAVSYLMKKYPSAKILVVAPYVNTHKAELKNAVHAIAEKYGVVCFDFESLPYWYYAINSNTTPLPNPDDTNGYWYTGNGNRCSANIEGYNQARFSWDTLHPSNLGYQTLAGPFGDKLING